MAKPTLTEDCPEDRGQRAHQPEPEGAREARCPDGPARWMWDWMVEQLDGSVLSGGPDLVADDWSAEALARVMREIAEEKA